MSHTPHPSYFSFFPEDQGDLLDKSDTQAGSFDMNHLLWGSRCVSSFIHLCLLSYMCEFISFPFTFPLWTENE